MALASFRSMSRAPEVKMALVTNVLIFAILGASMILRQSGMSRCSSRHVSVVRGSGVVAVTFMGLAQVMFNHFGFDRSGFRALVLLPTPRRHILLGKNLALLPVALVIFVILSRAGDRPGAPGSDGRSGGWDSNLSPRFWG